ncbi:hypothetical protein OAJ60_05695 [Planctomycetaceae bacterium]|nr:hypothetical protein [Planctomycetaceae bacterium]
MGRHWMLRSLLVALLSTLVAAAGCFNESSEEVTFDEGDLLLEEELSAADGESVLVDAKGAAKPALLSRLSEPAVHSLEKRVAQTLSQSSPDGLETSRAQLASEFDVRVEALGGGDFSYRVSYRRIVYSHTLPGETLSYDSTVRDAVVPPSLEHLRELASSGFSFQTTGGGVAFELTEVPATVYGGDLKGAAAAEFIADEIGMVLLGRGEGTIATAPAPQTRRVQLPVPMDINTRYSVKSTGQDTITLDMLASVTSSAEATQVTLVGGSASVKLGGGHSFGEMTVDAISGVPRHADWNRYIEISLKTDSGERIEQRKHEVVTIRATGETELLKAASLSAPDVKPVQPSR